MLAFTPEVQRAMERFDDAHTLVNADGRFWYQPFASVAGTEDSRDAHELKFLRRVHNDLVRPRGKAKSEIP